MAFDSSGYLVLDGLSILDDPRPSALQPVLVNGVHLRWGFGPLRAFPLYGYHLFRRTYVDSDERCLAKITSTRPQGILSNPLDTPFGRLSGGSLVATDDFEPPGSAEISLLNRGLRLDLPPGVSAWKVTARTGFLPLSSDIEFRHLPAGDGPNPRFTQGIRFEVFRAPGELAATAPIRTALNGGGLYCNRQLVVTLPWPAWHVTMFVDVQHPDRQELQRKPIRMRALNQDGSVAQEQQYTSPLQSYFSFEGTAITRVELDTPVGTGVLHRFKTYSREVLPPAIPLQLLSGGKVRVATEVTGFIRGVTTTELVAEGIDAIVFGAGPAALLDLCYWVRGGGLPTAAKAETVSGTGNAPKPGPWTKVPGFPYPLTLPIQHPNYPVSAGIETLSVRRSDAAQRIRTGSAAEALPAQPRKVGTGTITLKSGSALVTGKGTTWDASVVGQMLFPAQLDTAFAVMAVLAPDRLVLSRTYYGPGLADILYETAAEDVFAQVHDQAGALLEQPTAMREATMPPVLEQARQGRRAVLQNGSARVAGQGTSWSRELEGLLLEVGANRDLYRIVAVDPAKQEITLHAPYAGPGGPAEYRIVSRSPDNQIEDRPSLQISPLDLLELASLSPAYAQLLGLYWIDTSAERGATYDYMLLADHGGRFQGDGTAALRWLNGTPDFNLENVDGALLAGVRHVGSGALAAPAALQVFALPAGRPRLTLERPDLADAEPGLSIRDIASWPSLPPPQRPLLLDVWRLAHGTNQPPATPPGPAAYDHVDRFTPSRRDSSQAVPRPPGWPDPAAVHFIDGGPGGLDVGWYSYRASAVDLYGRCSTASPPIPWHDAVNGDQLHPYAVHLEDRTPPPPPTDVTAWVLEPESVNDPMRVVDDAYLAWRARPGIGPGARGLRLRWRWPWSHMLRAPDLTEFRIYAQSKPINARLHRIASVVPTPGDPARSDLTLAAPDAEANDAYEGAILQVGERGLAILASRGGAALRLRVRNGGPRGTEPPAAGAEATIVLPAGHRLHRDLLDPRHWERWLAAVAQQAPANATVRSAVEMLEDPSVVLYDDPANPLQGASASWDRSRVQIDDLTPGLLLTNVRPGIDVIALSMEAPPLFAVLAIGSVDSSRNRIQPAAPAPDWLTSGTYRWAIGPAERLLQGTAARWTAATRSLDLPGQPSLARVRPGIDLVYLQVTSASTPENLDHFFEVEAVDAARHRLLLSGKLSLLTNGAQYGWRIGVPLRTYELFLPARKVGDADDPRLTDWLQPSLAEPVAYATLGVSAADKRTERPDTRPGRVPARPGNEGQLAAPATVFRVHREPPAAPAEVAWDVTRLWATRADYHGRSYFTVRWPKPPAAQRPYVQALVFRAMDETLFQVDWKPNRPPLTPQVLPSDPRPAHWSAARKSQVIAELVGPASLYGKIRATSDFAAAQPLYRSLSDDALAVLANLPGNEEAFAQISIQALSHQDPANDDRRGPDDDLAVFPGPNPDLSAWLDTLDGRSQNRYLYKVAYVDPAQNRGPLSKAGPPVYLPKVVPPRMPVITQVLGGDRQITLHWAANREPDLAGYRVYRTDDKEKARDVRSMAQVAQVGPGDPEPAQRQAEVLWLDTLVPAMRVLFYRVTAIDSTGNLSEACAPAAGQAYDQKPPEPPVWNSAVWTSERTGIILVWSLGDPGLRTIVQRRHLGAWLPASSWLPEGTTTFTDLMADPNVQNRYRLQVRSTAGNLNVVYSEILVEAV